jgi:hypothetical protein
VAVRRFQENPRQIAELFRIALAGRFREAFTQVAFAVHESSFDMELS